MATSRLSSSTERPVMSLVRWSPMYGHKETLLRRSSGVSSWPDVPRWEMLQLYQNNHIQHNHKDITRQDKQHKTHSYTCIISTKLLGRVGLCIYICAKECITSLQLSTKQQLPWFKDLRRNSLTKSDLRLAISAEWLNCLRNMATTSLLSTRAFHRKKSMVSGNGHWQLTNLQMVIPFLVVVLIQVDMTRHSQ